MKNILVQKCRFYFKCFEKKDFEGLSKIFANNIYLEDWDNKIKGKKNNLKFLKNIFSKNSFKIKVQNFYLHKKKNIVSYREAGKIYVSNFGKIIQTIFSLFDLVVLFFIEPKKHKKENEYNLINEDISLNERI